jgi:hypothetical protein
MILSKIIFVIVKGNRMDRETEKMLNSAINKGVILGVIVTILVIFFLYEFITSIPSTI